MPIVIGQYRLRPAQVQAVKWDGSEPAAIDAINWLMTKGITATYHGPTGDEGNDQYIVVNTVNGPQTLQPGGYLAYSNVIGLWVEDENRFQAVYRPFV